MDEMSDDYDWTEWENRRSGGAGSLSQPLSNGEYRRQIEKLQR